MAVSSVAPTQSFSAPLPEIEAHQFQSTPVRTSKSGRVYLFQTEHNDLPKTGNLVLIHENNKPAMAFRVLKTDAEASEYVGKRVRRYDQTGELKMGSKYFSIEKVSDLLAQPAPEPIVLATPVPTPFPSITPVPAIAPELSTGESGVEENDAELDDARSAAPKKSQTNLEVYDYDDELDSSTSPRNLKNDRTDSSQVVGDEDDEGGTKTAYEIDEVIRLDPMKNMIGVHAGLFKNMSQFAFKGGTHSALSVSYTRTLSNDIWVKSRSPQDALAIEFGAGYYSRVNGDDNNDVYNVVPMYAELHYNLNFSQVFTLYLYAGAQYNGIVSTENVNPSIRPQDKTTIENLQGIQHTFGAGILYNMGPQWYLRLNLGWDRITAGLAIKW